MSARGRRPSRAAGTSRCEDFQSKVRQGRERGSARLHPERGVGQAGQRRLAWVRNCARGPAPAGPSREMFLQEQNVLPRMGPCTKQTVHDHWVNIKHLPRYAMPEFAYTHVCACVCALGKRVKAYG